MTIASQNDLIAARASYRQRLRFHRANTTANLSAGQMASLYRVGGALPSQPAIPSAAELPTKALTFNFNNPTGGRKTYLDVMNLRSTLAGIVSLYDRLFHRGGLSGIVTTAQDVSSEALLTFPARGGVAASECEWFLEWYADTGSTATTANVAVTYTDSSTGSISATMGATTRNARLIRLDPAAGKVIASVQSVTLAASTGSAGNFGVTCGRIIAGATAIIPLVNMGDKAEAILEEIPDDACLWQVVDLSTTSPGEVRGEYTLIQG